MTKKEAMPYLKLYKSYLDDMDFIELARETRSRYWDFYLLAWNADAAGDLLNRETGKPLTVKNMALRLRDDVTAVSNDLAALAAAGFITRRGDTWSIARYTEEQDSQSDMRKAWNDRQAKHRGKEIQPKENESQGNENELKETEAEPIIQSNQIKHKSHEEVTRDSHVTVDGQTDGESDPAITANSNSSKPSKPRAEEQTAMHPLVSDLVNFWKERTGSRISPYSQRIINASLFEGMNPDLIREKIEKTAMHEPISPDAYFTECMKPEEPEEEFINSVIRIREIKNTGELAQVCKENNVKPPTREQLIEWGIVNEQ